MFSNRKITIKKRIIQKLIQTKMKIMKKMHNGFISILNENKLKKKTLFRLCQIVVTFTKWM